MNKKTNVKKLAVLAMFGALAYVLMLVARVPVVMWLKYEPKDVILAICGLLYGPLPALGVTSVVAFVEMFQSTTGVWGLIMNILSSATFVCTASYVYKKKHTQKGALLGLVLGVAVMVPAMLLWNYLFTPIYMGQPREAVADMLLPVFLPFNLVKGSLNAAITMLVYKPVVKALRAAGLVERHRESGEKPAGRTGIMILSVVILAACICTILAFQGII